MQRDYDESLRDIIEAIDNIAEFTAGLSRDQWMAEKVVLHAVIRNLEVVGEATKNVPASIRELAADIPWQRIAGLRDILIHRYFGIDFDIIGDVAENRLPALRSRFAALLARQNPTNEC